MSVRGDTNRDFQNFDPVQRQVEKRKAMVKNAPGGDEEILFLKGKD
jgi:hypothetical protein